MSPHQASETAMKTARPRARMPGRTGARSASRGARIKRTSPVSAPAPTIHPADHAKKSRGGASKLPPFGSGVPSHSSHSWPSRRSTSRRMSSGRSPGAAMAVLYPDDGPAGRSASGRIVASRPPRPERYRTDRSPRLRRVFRRRGNLPDRARRGRGALDDRGAPRAGGVGCAQPRAAGASRRGERDDGRQRGARCRRGPHGARRLPARRESGGAPCGDRNRRDSPGSRRGGGAPWSQASARSFERALRDAGRHGLDQRGGTPLGSCGKRAALGRGAGAHHRGRRAAPPALRAAQETIRRKFPKTRKNSSGYALDAWLASGHLLDLVIGAEGTLGIVTRIEWRLEPVPAGYAGLRAALRTHEALAELVPRLLELGPSAVEYLDATFLRFAGAGAGQEEIAGNGGLLMVEFEAAGAAPLTERLGEARRGLGAVSSDLKEAGDRRGLEGLRAVRHAASPALARRGESRRSMQVIEDACVPVEALPRYIALVRAASERHGVEAVLFGHVGDGNLHVNLVPDVTRAGWEERVAAIFADVTAAVVRLGGTPSGEHGDGRLRAHALASVFGPEIVELFRLVKHAFDPSGILNPGVKLPAGVERPFASLKAGSGAAPIPADIEARLRLMEREAGYAVSRLDLTEAR